MISEPPRKELTVNWIKTVLMTEDPYLQNSWKLYIFCVLKYTIIDFPRAREIIEM